MSEETHHGSPALLDHVEIAVTEKVEEPTGNLDRNIPGQDFFHDRDANIGDFVFSLGAENLDAFRLDMKNDIGRIGWPVFDHGLFAAPKKSAFNRPADDNSNLYAFLYGL